MYLVCRKSKNYYTFVSDDNCPLKSSGPWCISIKILFSEYSEKEFSKYKILPEQDEVYRIKISDNTTFEEFLNLHPELFI